MDFKRIQWATRRTSARLSSLVIVTISSLIFFLTQCMQSRDEEGIENPKDSAAGYIRKISFQQFAGSATCAGCHKKIYEDHILTGHYHTSTPGFVENIKGSFEPGKNIFPFHPGLFVEMEKRDSGLFQVAYLNNEEKVARRFDIVMGSGAKGQSFLSWVNNTLFQLPITYFTAANSWCNSPGFPDKAIFNRPATSRCMECHTTYIDVTQTSETKPDEYNRNQLIYGVDCEKCHGPGAAHVEYETSNTKDTIGKYIVNPAKLNRQQVLDLCGLCHGGRLQRTKPAFEFTAGDYLANYFVKDTAASIAKIIDVHGNQRELMQGSKCFKNSATLTCITCHNSHENERNEMAVFAQRCMTCHNTEHNSFCKIKNVSGKFIKAKCIDCHMPKEPSMAVAVVLPGATHPTPAFIRTHLVKVYPAEVQKVLSVFNK